MEGRERFSDYLRTIRQGHYGILDVNVKLDIYQELINVALDGKAIRQRIGECIELQKLIRKVYNQRIRQDKKAEKEVSDNTKDFLNGSTMSNGHCSPMGSTKKQQKENDAVQVDHEKQTEKEQKSDIEKELEKLYVRTNSLGQDRDYNHYWFCQHEGRLFAVSSESNDFGYYRTKEELDALISSLNPKGTRESALKKQLEESYERISNALQEKSKEDARNDLPEEGELRRSARRRAPTRFKPAFLAYVNKLKED